MSIHEENIEEDVDIYQQIENFIRATLDGDKSSNQIRRELKDVLRMVYESHLDETDKLSLQDRLFEYSNMGKRNYNALCKTLKSEVVRNRYHLPVVHQSPLEPKQIFYEQFIKTALVKDFYLQGSAVINIKKYDNDYIVKIVDEKDLVRISSDVITIEKVRNGNNVHVELKSTDADIILRSTERLRRYLPELETYSDVPGFDKDFLPLRRGYSAQNKSFYGGDEIVPMKNTEVFNAFLHTFQFHDNDSKLRFVAYLCLLLLRNCISGPHPILLLIGPSQSGKTTLAKILNELYTKNGAWFHVGKQDEAEKQVATAMIHGKNMLFIDNFRTDETSFTSLEYFTTASEINIRLLHKNEFITKKHNDLIFVLTCNGGKISPDVENRSLIVGLDYEFSVDTQEISERKSNIINVINEQKDQILGHLMYLLKEEVFVGAESLSIMKTNWKNVGSFIIKQLYNTELYLKSGVFNTYVIYPILKLLPVSKMLYLASICQIRHVIL